MAEDSAVLDMEKLKETFFIECEEHVATMESSILEMEDNPDDEELMGGLFRAAHSLKGNSGCLGYMDINGFTHVLETVLEKVKMGTLKWSEELTSVMLDSVDATKLLIEAAKDEKDCTGDVEGTKQRLLALIDEKPVSSPEVAAQEAAEPAKGGKGGSFEIHFSPDPEILKRGMDPINKIILEIWESCEVLSVSVDTTHLPILDNMQPETCYLTWNVVVSDSVGRSVVEDIFEFVMDDSKIEITELGGDSDESESGPGAGDVNAGTVEEVTAGQNNNDAVKKTKAQAKSSKMGEATIRVDTDKVDALVNLVGELLITQAMINQLTKEQLGEKAAPLQRAAAQLERNTIEMQERVMSIRMLPIGSIFARFRRLVRDLAVAKGKKIRLDISGEETELDKTVIEKLADPLTHLLRNSVDHGIETPQERLAAGKEEEGIIQLNAYHEGGEVVISVSDDGAGINKEKIIKKAVEKGILNSAADITSDEDANALIFAAGFSTADVVSDVSGRGVGMDVVKRNIEEMGGSVGIESYHGEGTRFSLRLPLTLAIIQGLIVGIGQEKFIIPITMVLESKRPTQEEVKTVEGTGEVMSFRGHYVPIIRLYNLFKISPVETDPWNAIVVAISVEGKNYGLLVDELVGEQQVVIKGLGVLHGIGGIAGATILGDGRVALILDGGGVVKKAYSTK